MKTGKDWAVCGLLLLAVVCVFGQTLRYGFVNYDDQKYVCKNPHVSGGLNAEAVRWAFTTRHASNWHPLTWLSHMLDCQLYGLISEWHHLTNVLLHAATAILLFLILRQMTGDVWPSAFAAAVFAIHPLRVESVAWIAERKDVLSGLFFMLTLAAYLGYVRRPFSLARYLTVIGLFALGLMAKPMLVTLPFVLLLLDYWPLGRMTPWWRLVVEKLPLLAFSAASCAATLWAQSDAIASTDHVPFSLRLSNAAVSYVAYLVQLFYPVGLAVLYPLPLSGWPTWKVLGAVLVLLAISGGVVACRRRCPYLLLGWLWYLGMLLPVSGLLQVGSQAMADRYTYLPQIGLCIAIAWGASQATRSWPRRAWACGVASALAVATLMGCAWRQTSYWRDSETLWNRALDCTEQNHIANYNLGVALCDRGQVDEAIAQYLAALKVRPDYVDARFNLGVALASLGRLDDAVVVYRQVLELEPKFADAHNNLGVVLADLGQTDEAIAHYREALEIEPDLVSAYNNLGNVLANRGLVDEAIAEYRQALKINSDYAEAHNNLGAALLRREAVDEAIVHFEKALAIRPDYAEVHNNLGAVLERHGKLDEAIIHFQRALEINPDYAEAHNNLGVVLGKQGRIAEAIPHFRRALEINPNNEDARRNLNVALEQQGTVP